MFRAKRTIRNEEDKGKEDYQEQRRQGQRGLSGAKKTRAKRTTRNEEDKAAFRLGRSAESFVVSLLSHQLAQPEETVNAS